MRNALRHPDEETGGHATSKSPEQRRAHRFTLLIRSAKLLTEHGEFICVVRDASESGLSVTLFHPLPPCRDLVIEFQNGDRLAARMVWRKDDRAGFQFASEADIVRIIESPSEFTKRPVRVNLDAPALVRAGLEAHKVRLLNISQQGAKVATDAHFFIDRKVHLEMADIPALDAKVRWRGDETCGLVFENTFQLGEFARVVARLNGCQF